VPIVSKDRYGLKPNLTAGAVSVSCGQVFTSHAQCPALCFVNLEHFPTDGVKRCAGFFG
jgi:hypothetical protein